MTYDHHSRSKYGVVNDELAATPKCIRPSDEDVYTLHCMSGKRSEMALNDRHSENNVPTRKQSVNEDISRSSVRGKPRPYTSVTDTVLRMATEIVTGGK